MIRLFAFGSSLTSTYWNGAATYYRGIYKYLSRFGYKTIFAEPDIYNRQQNRDAEDLDIAEVRVYRSSSEITRLMAEAAECDDGIKHSGVGAEDEQLEEQVLACQSKTTRVVFWDVDAPATLARVEQSGNDPFLKLIGQYDFILTYGGGPPVIEHYLRLGARACHPIYNGLDPETHYPVAADPRFRCDLAFVGNRLPDREARVEEFLLRAAYLAPEMSFILGGEGWEGKSVPANVRRIGHVGSKAHNQVNCSARMVLNINRESMAEVGFSPPTRVFEAAGAGACLISDQWTGVEQFFTPGEEILLASSAEDVAHLLRNVDQLCARRLGGAMRERALREHSYRLRAAQFHAILEDHRKPRPKSAMLAS